MANSVAIGVAYKDQELVAGTMSQYGIANSTISGSTISGSAISGAPANVTNLTASGNVALGDSTSDTFALYGAAGTTQPTSASQAAVATTQNATSSSATQSVFGFTTSTQANQIVSLVNQLRSDLVALGLIKGS